MGRITHLNGSALFTIPLKQIFKRMRFHVPNTSFLSICKPLPLNAAKNFKIKKSSALKIKRTPGRVFWIFERKRVLFGPRQKNCYKSCLLHLNHFNLGTTHLWTLTKIILILVMWSKWWRQQHFWWRHHSTTNFFVFQIIPLPKINCFYWKVMT